MRVFRSTFLGLTAGAALALAVTGASAEGLGDRGSVKDGPYAAPSAGQASTSALRWGKWERY
jgi:hypothetical protein